MTTAPFYKLDGSPIQGRIPVRVRVHDYTPYDSGAVRAAVNAFLATTHLSPASSHLKELALKDGTRIRMRKIADQIYVDVYPARVEEEAEEDFYGGILLTLKYLPDEAAYFDASANPIDVLGTQAIVIDEIKAEGKTSERPGRPSVPGPHGEGDTEQLIIQIADRPFSDHPIRDGMVKVFRARQMLAGPYPEVHYDPERYVLSMNATGEQFFFAGELVESLPPLPTAAQDDFFGWGSGIRLRTLGFGAPSFEEGRKAKGLVLAAIGPKLWACDASLPAPQWGLLAEAEWAFPPAYANTFGADFVETENPNGGVTITCSGTNGAGACSGFSVTVTPIPGGGRAVAGTITLAHDGTPPQVAQENSTTTVDMSTLITLYAIGIVDVGRGGSTINLSYARNYEYSGGWRRDRITGEWPPAMGADVGEETYELTMQWTPVDSYIPPFGTDVVTEFSGSLAMSWSLSGSGRVGGSFSQEASGLAGRGSGVGWEFASGGGSCNVTGGGGPCVMDPNEVRKRTRQDVLGKLAWEREVHHSADIAPMTFDASFTAFKANRIVDGFGLLPPGATGIDTTTYTYNELTLATRLITPNRTARVEYTNTFSLLSEPPAWAAAQPAVEAKYSNIVWFGSFGGRSFVYGFSDDVNHTVYETFVPSTLPGTLGGFFGMLWSPVRSAWRNREYPEFQGSEGELLIGVGPFGIDDFGAYQQFQNTNLSITWSGPAPVFTTLGHLRANIPFARQVRGPNDLNITATSYINPSVSRGFPGVNDPLPPPILDQSRLTNQLTDDRDWIVRDFRTGGFVANHQWTLRYSSVSFKSFVQTYIGNEHSIVPLRQIIDEWRALGSTSATTDEKVLLPFIFGASLV